jgi:hypothetical protein
MDVDNIIDFFLDERTNVIEDCFFFFAHCVAQSIIIFDLKVSKNLEFQEIL